MRVLWASHSGRIGGAELCLYEGAKALRALGAEIRVVAPWEGALQGRLHAASVSTVRVPLPLWTRSRGEVALRMRGLRGAAQATPPLVRAVRDFRPDIVVTNTITIPTPALAAKVTGVPHVWFLHEFGDLDHGLIFYHGHRASMVAIRLLSRRVLVNSRALRDHFTPHLGRKPVDLVHYAVEVPDPQGGLATPKGTSPSADRLPLRLILVGTKHPGKRQEDAVRAVGRLRRCGTDARLTLVGPADPAYEAALHRLVDAEGCRDAVAFVGHTDDPHAYYADADVALMCSMSEAFGRVTVEAMKHGLPVVGAASAGTLGLIREGGTGWLYPPGDAEGLADVLVRLHADRPALRAAGARAQAWASETFSLARYGLELQASLEAALRP